MNATCTACQTIFRVDPAKVPAAGVRARCSVCSGVFWVRHAAAVAATPAPAVQPVTPPVSSAPPPAPEPIPLVATVAPPVSAPIAPAVAPARVEIVAQPEPLLAPLPPVVPRPEGPAVAPPVRRPEPTEPLRLPPSLAQPSGWPALPPTVNPSPRPAPPAAPARPGYASPAVPMPDSSAELPATPATRKPRGNPFLSQDPAAKARRLARALISDMVVYHPAKRREGLQNASLKRLFDEEIRKSWEEYVDQVGKDVAESTPFFHEALNEILAGGSPVFP